jgi:hypothetical protein
MSSLYRAFLGLRMSSLQITISVIFSLLLLFVPKNALAMNAMDCFPHVGNVTIDDVRYLQITRESRKECSLYLMAKSFPQLGEDGKPLPIQQQLRSIKAANDRLMEGKRGVRPVHSNCVPDSKPWSDQTLTEREMCAEQLVNYYPVTNQILIPKIPQLSKSEQIQKLSVATCKALSNVPNPTDDTKKILVDCQKQFAGIVIQPSSVSKEKQQLAQARAEVASLIDENTKFVTTNTQQGEKLASLTATSRSAHGLAGFFFVAFGLVLVDAVRARRKNRTLQGRLNIADAERDTRVDDELAKRKAGPTQAEHESVLLEVTKVQRKLQEVTNEKTELSMQISGNKQQHEKCVTGLTAEQDSLNEQIAVLGNKRDKLVVQNEIQATQLVEEQGRSGRLAKELTAVKNIYTSLGLQLELLWTAEQRVRTEDIEKLSQSIELANTVVAALDKRHMTLLANGEMKKAVEIAGRIDALNNRVHETAIAEHKARSSALSVLTANDPKNTDPENLLRALTTAAEGRRDNLAPVVQMNLTLDKLSNQLASDNDEALEQIAQLRATNAKLQEIHDSLILGIGRAVKMDLKALSKLEPEDQAHQLALKVGEIQSKKLAGGDLQEQVLNLRDQNDDLREHNASLRQAMEGEPDRQTIATMIYSATTSEAEKIRMGRIVDDARAELKVVTLEKERLQEAVRHNDGKGLLALEATELVVLPTHRLMHLIQQGVLAVHNKPDSAADAEWVVGSDEALSALNGFLHLPLVSANGYRLPPKLKTTWSDILVCHVADEVCKLRREQEPRVMTSVTQTMSPPAMPVPSTDMRKQTMQGLGAVIDRKRIVPFPPEHDSFASPKVPQFDLGTDPDEDKGSTH